MRLKWYIQHDLKADTIHDKPFILSFLQKEFDRQAGFTYMYAGISKRSTRYSFKFVDM